MNMKVRVEVKKGASRETRDSIQAHRDASACNLISKLGGRQLEKPRISTPPIAPASSPTFGMGRLNRRQG